jgi:asparagine synthase (glutamine-hydrolysing)
MLNGEIYNYRHLADELDLKDLDPLDPESHVIQALLARWGWSGVARLEGMFAIAATSKQRTLLARDRLGIKPLYYALCGDTLVFGSEIKALLAHPDLPLTLDEQALDEIATFGYIASPEFTPFAAVKQVPPASVVEVCNGHVICHTYWQPAPAFSDGHPSLVEKQAESLIRCLRDSLNEMLEHDPLPKGFYLSGGVDSGLLTILATEALGAGVQTFTLADSEPTADLLAARELARALGCDHHELRVNIQDYVAELPVFVRHYESVIAGGVFGVHGGMAFQLLSREVAKHVRVAFSGEGADELFGGYYWPYTHPLGFVDGIRARLRAIGSPKAATELVGHWFPEPEDEATYRLRVFDFLMRGGLANYHLWSVDRSSSAFGFEVRPAYLHDQVVQKSLALPVEAKVLGDQTKRVLKAAARPLFERHGLGHLVDRPKTGMPAAVSGIAKQLDQWARTLVSAEHLRRHPFARWVSTPLESVMFDLFFHIFVQNRGMLPTGFDVVDFYRSGACADMYR